MANQYRIGARRIEPAVDGVVQRGPHQDPPTVEQEVVAEHKVALVGGRRRRLRAFSSRSDSAGRYVRFCHGAHCAVSSAFEGVPPAVCPLAVSMA